MYLKCAIPQRCFCFFAPNIYMVSSNIENGSHEVNVPHEWTLD